MVTDRRQGAGPVLIFDLSEVLVGGLFGVVEPLAERLGVGEEEVMDGLGGEAWLAFMEGASDEAEYWRSVLAQTSWQVPVDELAAIARRSFRQEVPGMPELVDRLHGQKLALLSDHGRDWMRFIVRSHPFLACFERRFLSFEMGRTKRQPDTFQWVVAELGRDPAECLFIDDLATNVERARDAGLTAIRFRSAAQLSRRLSELGIRLR